MQKLSQQQAVTNILCSLVELFILWPSWSLVFRAIFMMKCFFLVLLFVWFVKYAIEHWGGNHFINVCVEFWIWLKTESQSRYHKSCLRTYLFSSTSTSPAIFRMVLKTGRRKAITRGNKFNKPYHNHTHAHTCTHTHTHFHIQRKCKETPLKNRTKNGMMSCVPNSPNIPKRLQDSLPRFHFFQEINASFSFSKWWWPLNKMQPTHIDKAFQIFHSSRVKWFCTLLLWKDKSAQNVSNFFLQIQLP